VKHLTKHPRVALADLAWEDDTAGEGEPGSRLLATLYIGSCPFHVQAIELKYEDDGAGGSFQTPVDPTWDEEFEGLYAATGSADPWDTVQIGGRQYGLYIYPFNNGTDHE
jgi:hypothetical protein